jgi:hypothetical protein
MEDEKFEDKIKNLSYEYPVAFPVFWKAVRGKLSGQTPALRPAPVITWAVSGLAAAAVIFVFTFLFINMRPVALVTMTRGHAEVRTAGSKVWRPVSLRENITPGMEFRTSGPDSMELQIDGNERIRLNGGTVVTLQDIGPLFRNSPTVVKLEQGTIEVQTRFSRPETRFVVLSSQVKIVSGNNRLNVTCGLNGDTGIDALDGPVTLEPSVAKADAVLEPVRISGGRNAEISEKEMNGLFASIGENHGNTAALQKRYEQTIRVNAITHGEYTTASGVQKAWITDPNSLIKAYFISAPADARVILNGREIGSTPLSSLQEKNKTLSLVVIKSGFALFSTNIRPTNDAVLSFPLEKDNGSLGENAELGSFPERLEWFENLPTGILEKPCAFNEGYVYCADGNTVKTFYNRKLVKSVLFTKDRINLTRPLYWNGKVYAASDNGSLYSYSLSTEEVTVLREGGKTRNSHQPVAAGDWVALVTADQGVELFNQEGKADKAILREESKNMASDPYFYRKKGYMILATADGKLIAYDVRNSRMSWTVNHIDKTGRITDPLAGNNTAVFVFSAQTGMLSSYRLSDGKLLWKRSMPDTAGAAVQIKTDNERVFLTSVSGPVTRFAVLNSTYGNSEFQQIFPGELLAPVLMEGKTVLISKSGRTALYEPAIQEIEYNSILK